MDPRLLAIENDLVARWFEFHPASAFFAGVHDHDRELGDLSREGIEGFCADLDRLRARASGLGSLDPHDEAERDTLLSRIDGALYDYRGLQTWRTSPFEYAETISAQLNGLLIFDHAPVEERLLSVIAKERKIPGFLAQARRNLEPTAPILARYGARGVRGALSLIETDIPATLGRQAPPALKRKLEESTSEAARALRGFLDWLEHELPAGREDAYALGRERFSEALRTSEMVTTSPEALERWALDQIERSRAALAEAAARMDGAATPAEVVARINADHPKTGGVIEAATRIADEVWEWMRARRLVSFPTDVRVQVAATPEFMRWSFGSMWTPGPFEKPHVRATYYATDADPAWPAGKQEEHLTAFSYRGLENLAIHEAYPGHYIQMRVQHRVASPVRRLFWWGAFGEGWAHYCEQMAIEQGFGGGEPAVQVVQLQEALNRLCRFVHCIRLHAGAGWDFEQGTRFFVEKAWLAGAVARAEAERAAFDPFYLRYTLGKKEILELREELRAELGPRFDLGLFHDALLQTGSGPMSCVRRLCRLGLGLKAGA